jgi:hypothetical protein
MVRIEKGECLHETLASEKELIPNVQHESIALVYYCLIHYHYVISEMGSQ